MQYDQKIVCTIARCMFITPMQHVHNGYDWPSKQREWESLSDNQKQIWFDKAIIWLNDLSIKMPDAYEFYMKYGIPDQGSRYHLFND
jgi:hypothetical protein